MKLSDFDYYLPKELIAQYPLLKRDSARLLVLERSTGRIEHCVFRDILDYFKKDDLLVLNDTKVLPARLIGRRSTGGRVEVLLLGQRQGLNFKALLSPGRLRIGEKINFAGGKTHCTINARNEISFNLRDPESVYRLGAMPLPPYIKREVERRDNLYYQTVYARNPGAVASPTAGLHFTRSLLQKLKLAGTNIAYLTLHVGIGTFKPVRAEDIRQHKIEPEYFEIPEESLDLIEKARLEKSRIIAVGTTSCRALESYTAGKNAGDTGLFIYPGYKFKITNCLLTNFHLPATTLLMLVSAFAGRELIKKAYQEAIAKKYRFYSYGDAMLII